MTQSSVLGQIGNVPGASYRLDANSVAQALATFSAGSAPPDPTYPWMLWWDTTINRLKMRNPANSGWVEIGWWTGSEFRPMRDGVLLGTAATKDFGINANQLVELDGNARLPAVDASQLLNLPAGAVTGDLKLTFENTALAGWLFCDGKTLGSVASGAIHAGTTYQPLFVYVWERITEAWCPVTDSGGNPVARSGSAQTDWDAGRRLSLPDARGSLLLIMDTMGASAAGRVTSASTGGGNASQMAARGGAETHTLTVDQLPSHDHDGTTGSDGDHSHTYIRPDWDWGTNLGLQENNFLKSVTPNAATGNAGAHTHTIPAQGGGQAHSTMPPWFSLNLLIKV
ncbi:MAG: hypothetical protein H6905_02615 [Hyphomicrobiales bacterium]|nr:hypothetical protein [Hyphomicrobiales bacterium]